MLVDCWLHVLRANLLSLWDADRTAAHGSILYKLQQWWLAGQFVSAGCDALAQALAAVQGESAAAAVAAWHLQQACACTLSIAAMLWD